MLETIISTLLAGLVTFGALALVLIALYAFVAYWKFGPSGANRSRDFNRYTGKWRVRYRSGKISEPMCHDVASDYADIFGGEVEPIHKS